MHLERQSLKSIILFIHWAPFWGFAQIPACRSFIIIIIIIIISFIIILFSFSFYSWFVGYCKLQTLEQYKGGGRGEKLEKKSKNRKDS